MLNIDPPAIAGGTDLDQVGRTTFEAGSVQGAVATWLETFAKFCRNSGGLEVM